MRPTLHVLLVEDNPGDVDLTCETLHAGRVPVAIEVAGDGPQALAWLQQGWQAGSARPDLILLDLNLPGMSGGELLAEVKGQQQWCDLPVVVLSSSDAERDVLRSQRLGATAHLTKPLGLQSFEDLVRRLHGGRFESSN